MLPGLGVELTPDGSYAGVELAEQARSLGHLRRELAAKVPG
jgi:hypothetical protein